MATYGIPTDLTYSVSLAGIDEVMSTLADNDVNLITARNVRDVVYTLYDDILNIQTFSFSYTSATPSTVDVGGITAGTTFSNVSLQNLFDRMFLKFVDVDYDLTVINPSPALYEYGNYPGGTASVLLEVTLTKGTNTIVSCTLSTPNDPPYVFNPPIPTTGTTVSYITKTVIPDQLTTYTLTLSDFDGTTGQSGRQISATVGWYYGRYYGFIDLSSISPQLDLRNITASQSLLLDTLIDGRLGLTGPNGIANLNIHSQELWGTTLSFVTPGVDPEHMIIAWPSTDWSYSSFPRSMNNNFYMNVFTKVKSLYSGVLNQWGYSLPNYDIYISYLPQGSTELKIFNQQQ